MSDDIWKYEEKESGQSQMNHTEDIEIEPDKERVTPELDSTEEAESQPSQFLKPRCNILVVVVAVLAGVLCVVVTAVLTYFLAFPTKAKGMHCVFFLKKIF